MVGNRSILVAVICSEVAVKYVYFWIWLLQLKCARLTLLTRASRTRYTIFNSYYQFKPNLVRKSNIKQTAIFISIFGEHLLPILSYPILISKRSTFHPPINEVKLPPKIWQQCELFRKCGKFRINLHLGHWTLKDNCFSHFMAQITS